MLITVSDLNVLEVGLSVNCASRLSAHFIAIRVSQHTLLDVNTPQHMLLDVNTSLYI